MCQFIEVYLNWKVLKIASSFIIAMTKHCHLLFCFIFNKECMCLLVKTYILVFMALKSKPHFFYRSRAWKTFKPLAALCLITSFRYLRSNNLHQISPYRSKPKSPKTWNAGTSFLLLHFIGSCQRMKTKKSWKCRNKINWWLTIFSFGNAETDTLASKQKQGKLRVLA